MFYFRDLPFPGAAPPLAPKALFEVAAIAQFDVSKDGRFLIQVPVEQAVTNVQLTVVVNWQAGLKK